jgi:hypothetical protein
VEVLALQHLRNREFGGQPDKALEAQREQPFAVEADFGLGRIEDLEDLRLVGLGVGVDLLAGERRTRPVGSPISPVPSPMRKMAVWPMS